MNLVLVRNPSGITCTIGELFVQRGDVMDSFCNSLEDLVRPQKIPGETAIPAGTYELALTESPAARRGHLWTPRSDFKLPQLLNVPGYEGVRIHAGNTHKDTEGCILVGTWNGGEFISSARASLTALLDLMEIDSIASREHSIEIRDAE